MTCNLATVLLSLMLSLTLHPLADAAPATARPARLNLIANGNAETVDDGGALVNWSVHVREGSASLQPTKSDQVEGQRAARLEIHRGGANFDLRTGRPVVPRLGEDATYLFTAFFKSESDPATPAGAYFCLGTDSDLRVGYFRHNAGWQEVRLKITIPAGEQLRRLELSGGAKGPSVILVDSVCLTRLTEAEAAEAEPEPRPLETAIPLASGRSTLVRKILPTDCRLVRAFSHGSVDGRVDTRYATGVISEWCGIYGEPTIDYRLFNGNNGLHITLAESGFNALQIRGGWRGALYADTDTLTVPAAELPYLCTIQSRGKSFHRLFEPAVDARRLSFFYIDWEQAERGQPLTDVAFLRVTPDSAFAGATSTVSYRLGKPADLDPTIAAAMDRRFAGPHRAFRLGTETPVTLSLSGGEYLHLLTPRQDPAHGIGAVALHLRIDQIATNAVLTVRVQDVVDPRRECMGVDFLVPGPGDYRIALDVPDQVFLPPEESWPFTPHLDRPFAPPPVVWIAVAAESPMRLADAEITLHRVARDRALVEAGAWRKLMLKGLFSNLSEPRPWDHLDNKSPVSDQIATKKSIARYRDALLELLDNVECARLLMPNDDIVRQYYFWIYHQLYRDDPPAPPELPAAPGAPRWAVLIRENWRELNFIISWWLDNRLVPDGEFGGNINDDTVLYQCFSFMPMIESAPLGARLKDAAARLCDLAWEHQLEEGINKNTMDGLHAYEEGINQVALCAWWFYGDPVYFERAMISAKSVLRLLVETKDGRVHFGSRYVGIDQARHGYEKIGASPGVFNWAPERFLFHPVYLVSWYNRNPTALHGFERWGQTWADYQKPGAFVEKVDIATGKPLPGSGVPSTANVGPLTEWLALYQVTNDPKWQQSFLMGLAGNGYIGTRPDYGRMEHALVDWGDLNNEKLRGKYHDPKDGYAGFFLNQDRSLLDYWLETGLSWFRRFRHMNTAAEPKDDRVITHKATTAMCCYLGDAPNRNRYLNFGAVSYEGLRGDDFAALVWDAGRDRLRVAIYNFRDQPITGLMRVWRLDHGRYRVRCGPDANDDGKLDEAASDEIRELQRYASINLDLPAKQVTVVDVEQLGVLDDTLDRADLALSPFDTRLDGDGKLEVKVHNIGAKPAHQVLVNLVRDGQVIASQTIKEIEDPHDLKPRIVSVVFDAEPGDIVMVDPDNAIPEIAEHNNRLTVSDRH